jgi:hypothetical protein
MMTKIQIRLIYLLILALLLGLSRLHGLLGLQALRLAALHRSIVRVCLLVVLTARSAEKVKNRLGVFGSHIASLRRWPVAVKDSWGFRFYWGYVPYCWRSPDSPNAQFSAAV